MMHACMHRSALCGARPGHKHTQDCSLDGFHCIQEQAAPRPTTSISHCLDTFPQARSGNGGRDGDLWGSILANH